MKNGCFGSRFFSPVRIRIIGCGTEWLAKLVLALVRTASYTQPFQWRAIGPGAGIENDGLFFGWVPFMNETDRVELEWIRSLVCEAERDLVFLWHVAAAKFGGPAYTSEVLPLVIERVATALIGSGCTVGFGDPDSKTWQEDADLLRAENPGALIAARWLANPTDVEFMVFALRRSRQDQ